VLQSHQICESELLWWCKWGRL